VILNRARARSRPRHRYLEAKKLRGRGRARARGRNGKWVNRNRLDFAQFLCRSDRLSVGRPATSSAESRPPLVWKFEYSICSGMDSIFIIFRIDRINRITRIFSPAARGLSAEGRVILTILLILSN